MNAPVLHVAVGARGRWLPVFPLERSICEGEVATGVVRVRAGWQRKWVDSCHSRSQGPEPCSLHLEHIEAMFPHTWTQLGAGYLHLGPQG